MFRFIVVFVSFVLLGGLVVFAQRAGIPSSPDQESKSTVIQPTTQTPRSKRLREGTAFRDKLVSFQETGDRIVLYTVEDNQRFTCLENLALERVLAASREKPNREFWKIDGDFTEFRGDNFAIIRRAVVAQAPANTVPIAP